MEGGNYMVKMDTRTHARTPQKNPSTTLFESYEGGGRKTQNIPVYEDVEFVLRVRF